MQVYETSASVLFPESSKLLRILPSPILLREVRMYLRLTHFCAFQWFQSRERCATCTEGNRQC